MVSVEMVLRRTSFSDWKQHGTEADRHHFSGSFFLLRILSAVQYQYSIERMLWRMKNYFARRVSVVTKPLQTFNFVLFILQNIVTDWGLSHHVLVVSVVVRQRFSDWKMHSTKANNRHHLITGTGRSLFLRFITVLYSTVSIERIEFGYNIRCHVPVFVNVQYL